MSKNNPMKNPITADRVKRQKQIPVIIDGKRFASVKDAAKAMGVWELTVTKWCKRGYDTQGKPCRHESEQQKAYTLKTTSSRAVLIDDKRFPSVKSAAQYLGVWSETLIRNIKKNTPCKGHICRYDNQQPSCENPIKVSQKVQRLTGEDGNQ